VHFLQPLTRTNIALKSWGLSLSYALQLGMRHPFMLDDSEIDFEQEGPWSFADPNLHLVSISFIASELGGTGYLLRIAAQFHLVARRSLKELEHGNCETSCYRCLKSYENQLLPRVLILAARNRYTRGVSQHVSGTGPT
jgi:hypothetical protein